MNKNLFLKLIEKNILTKDTVIEARHTGNLLAGISTQKIVGEFIFENFTNDYVFLKKVNSTVIIKVSLDDILKVDGMDPTRLAGIYGIKPDGSKKKEKIDPITGLPVRRGRKTNKVKEIINERLNKLGAGSQKPKRAKQA